MAGILIADDQARSAPFAVGLLTGREDARIDAAIATATKAYGDLVKVRRFWR